MKLRMDLTEPFRQQSVAAHAHPDARLADLKNNHYTRCGHHGADGNDVTDFPQVDLFKYVGEGIGNIPEFRVIHHSRNDQRDNHIDNGTDDQGIDHAPGQITLWVSAFFCRRRNGVKTDISKKDSRHPF